MRRWWPGWWVSAPNAERLPDIGTRIAFGIVVTVVALALALSLWSVTPPSPFLLFYPAVVLAAWRGGFVSGVTVTLLSTFAVAWVFLSPADSLEVTARRDALDLLIFGCMSLLITHFIAGRQRALARSRAALAEVEAATAAKETVLAVVAHDLRNPLQTIGLGAEMLEGELHDLDGSVKAQLSRIRRCAERARRLVDNILDSARIGANPFPIAVDECSLAELVEEGLHPFRPIAAVRSIRLDVPDPSSLEGAVVRCDRDRIVQVLSNLVGNALQYTPSGGRVTVRVARAPDGVELRISDSGCGMSEDELAHAFERLWHGQGPGHGSGLGLWISKALVEAHGGRISATSQPDHGTTMTFFLPATGAVAGASERARPWSSPRPAPA